MKKLMLSASVLAMSVAAAYSHAENLGLNPLCNSNGTLINPAYSWNGETYRYCELPSTIAVNDTIELPATLGNAKILWVLPQVVTVGDGHSSSATPTTVDRTQIVIAAGARIAGAIQNSALVMTRGTSLVASGEAGNPIIFSSLDEGFSGKGEWGGVILSGFGISNQCKDSSSSCTMEGISDGTYYFGGGTDTNMSSGSLNYVVITEGGSVIDVDTDGDTDPNSNSGDEINGLTLYAVNDTTTLSHIHIHDNLDDGIEFFGGDVDASNLWLTCNQDDSVDWDHGYQGNLLNVQIIQQNGADHAFELANNPNNFSATPVANGNVTHASLILRSGQSDVPFMFKEGTSGMFNDILVTGYGAVDCETAGNVHSVTFGSQVSYDCDNVTGLLPASGSATGFPDVSFWTATQGNPGCN